MLLVMSAAEILKRSRFRTDDFYRKLQALPRLNNLQGLFGTRARAHVFVNDLFWAEKYRDHSGLVLREKHVLYSRRSVKEQLLG